MNDKTPSGMPAFRPELQRLVDAGQRLLIYTATPDSALLAWDAALAAAISALADAPAKPQQGETITPPADLSSDVRKAEQLLTRLVNTLYPPGDHGRAHYLLRLASAVLDEVGRGVRPLVEPAAPAPQPHDGELPDWPADLPENPSALLKFIHENEPADTEGARAFRDGLTAVLREAQPQGEAAAWVGRVRIDSGEVHIVPRERNAEASPLVDGQRVYTAPPARQALKPLTDAARDVLAERQRQIEAEGWTPEHDDHEALADCGDAGHAEGRCGNASCCRGPAPPARQALTDAERYQWILTNSRNKALPMVRVLIMSRGQYVHRQGDDLTAAVDALRERLGQPR